MNTLDSDSEGELVCDEILAFTGVSWTVGVWVPVGVVIVVKCVTRFESCSKRKGRNEELCIFIREVLTRTYEITAVIIAQQCVILVLKEKVLSL